MLGNGGGKPAGALQLLEEVLVEGEEIAAHICEIRFKGLLMGQGRG